MVETALQMFRSRTPYSSVTILNVQIVGGEATLNPALPYRNDAGRGEVQSFAHRAATYVDEEQAGELEQELNEGFWSKGSKMLSFRSSLSRRPKPKP